MLPEGTNTYAGIIVALAAIVLPVFGITPTPEFGAEFPQELAAWTLIGGLVYAAYGRARAKVPGWFAKK